MCQNEDEIDRRRPKVRFVLEIMCDERTNLLLQSSTNSLVRSSQVLSRTNEKFRLWVHFRLGTRTAY